MKNFFNIKKSILILTLLSTFSFNLNSKELPLEYKVKIVDNIAIGKITSKDETKSSLDKEHVYFDIYVEQWLKGGMNKKVQMKTHKNLLIKIL